MNRCLDGFKYLLLGAVLALPIVGFGQESPRRFEIEATFGFLAFDPNLLFQRSPSIGLGVGHDITHLLQLNLNLVMSPTQQRISAATTDKELRTFAYHYSANVRLAPERPIFWRIRPFVSAGVGGAAYHPEDITLELGGGRTSKLRLSTDHRFAINAAFGMVVKMSTNFNLIIAYRAFFPQVRQIVDDTVSDDTTIGRNSFFGFGAAVSF